MAGVKGGGVVVIGRRELLWNSWWRSTERGVGGSRCKFQDRE